MMIARSRRAALKLTPGEVRACEIRPEKVGALETGMLEIEPGEVEVGQVLAAEIHRRTGLGAVELLRHLPCRKVRRERVECARPGRPQRDKGRRLF